MTVFNPYTFDPIPARGKVEKVLKMGDCFYEAKLDGSRQILAKIDGVVTLTGRRNSVKTGKKLNKILWVPHLEKFISQIPDDIVLDGELICLPATSSNEVTKIMGSKLDRAIQLQEWPREPLVYYVFDILRIANLNLEYVPLIERKAKLKELFSMYPTFNPLNKHESYNVGLVPEYLNCTHDEAFEKAQKDGHEGIIVKWQGGFYHHLSWAKMKSEETYDLVIMGVKDSEAETYRGTGIAALKLGLYNDDGILVECCMCSGMNDEWRSNFFNDFEWNGGETYVGLVAEVQGQQMFKTGAIRHPRFKGLREDLNPKEQTFSKYGVNYDPV